MFMPLYQVIVLAALMGETFIRLTKKKFHDKLLLRAFIQLI